MEQSAKWTRRDGDGPEPRCAVPECPAPAVATVRIDADVSRAWIVDLAEHTDGAGHDLCARHAGAIRPGEGWFVHDERDRSRRQPASIDAARRSRPLDTPAVPSLPVPAQVDLRRRGNDAEAPEDPHPAANDLLDARSPLLARAFAKSRA